MHTLHFNKPALKTISKMPKSIAKHIQTEFKCIAANPAAYRGDWKPLKGSAFWRLRIGDWRAICDLRNDSLVLLVLKIATIEDIYK